MKYLVSVLVIFLAHIILAVSFGKAYFDIAGLIVIASVIALLGVVLVAVIKYLVKAFRKGFNI